VLLPDGTTCQWYTRNRGDMHAKSHAHIEENRRADRHSMPGRQQKLVAVEK